MSVAFLTWQLAEEKAIEYRRCLCVLSRCVRDSMAASCAFESMANKFEVSNADVGPAAGARAGTMRTGRVAQQLRFHAYKCLIENTTY